MNENEIVVDELKIASSYTKSAEQWVRTEFDLSHQQKVQKFKLTLSEFFKLQI